MATGTAIEIEPWAEASTDPFSLREYFPCGLEKLSFARVETGKGAAGTGGSSP